MFDVAASRLRAFFSLTRHHLHQAGMLRADLGLEAARNAESIRQERAAKRRALGLLIRLLTPAQRNEFRHALHFNGSYKRTPNQHITCYRTYFCPE